MTEVTIASPRHRQRWWWIPLTVAAITVVNAALVSAEHQWLTSSQIADDRLSRILLAHVIAGAACAVVLSLPSALGADAGRSFLTYSERYLRGLVYGIITSIAITVTIGLVLSTSSGQPAGATAQAIGVLLSFSVVSMQLPLACIVGAVVWQLVSKDRRPASPDGPPRRPRRPIEDQE